MKPEKPKGPIDPEQFLNPRSAPFVDPRFRGNLPHLEKPGCSYFVTFCLFDVAPKRSETRQLTELQDDPAALAARSEPSTSGSCLLRDPQAARIVEDSLLHFQGDRYALSAWCVMPNHVHAVVTPYHPRNLLEILHSWKSFTAHAINKQLNRTGSVWQEESFDHLIRRPEAFEGFVSYVENNPVAAGLAATAEEWPFSSARFRIPERS